MAYDARRTAWMETHGYRVLRFANVAFLKYHQEALETILRAIRERLPPSP